jgi:transposase
LRSEQAGQLVLPQREFGFDVTALIGALRHAQHRSLPQIHAEMVRRGVTICARSVGNLLDRYDDLLALSCSAAARLRRVTAKAGWMVLAIDGLQPDVGHEVLWVFHTGALWRDMPRETYGPWQTVYDRQPGDHRAGTLISRPRVFEIYGRAYKGGMCEPAAPCPPMSFADRAPFCFRCRINEKRTPRSLTLSASHYHVGPVGER